jgi:citrate lyase subunit beta/citryl-CoA lyase
LFDVEETMSLRSFLFVPADNDAKLAKIDTTPADAFILDLEDSVAMGRKDFARGVLADFFVDRSRSDRKSQLWVRINPLNSDHVLKDLAAVIPLRPDGLMLPKAASPICVQQLTHYLEILETEHEIEVGQTQILPLVTETPEAVLRLAEYARFKSQRVYGLSWGAEDLSAAVGASTNKNATGELDFTYQMARSQTLLAASAMGVNAVDTLLADFKDDRALLASSRASRSAGFTGRLAIHPAQVSVINEAYLPTQSEVQLAREIVATFEANPDLGTVGIGDKMYDMPHLTQARKTIATYEAFASL